MSRPRPKGKAKTAVNTARAARGVWYHLTVVGIPDRLATDEDFAAALEASGLSEEIFEREIADRERKAEANFGDPPALYWTRFETEEHRRAAAILKHGPLGGPIVGKY